MDVCFRTSEGRLDVGGLARANPAAGATWFYARTNPTKSEMGRRTLGRIAADPPWWDAAGMTGDAAGRHGSSPGRGPLQSGEPPLDVVMTEAHAERREGKACNAAKRFIVLDELYDAFLDRFAGAMGRIEPGDPTLESTFLGPLSSAAARDNLVAQVDGAVSQGATVQVGGRPVDGPGFGYLPTVLTGVTADMDVFTQELFVPVAVVHRAADEEEAIALANATPFGLGASVHSDDPDRAWRVADRLDAGMVSINESGGSRADLLFGGVKRSGFGRELGSYGITEFVNHKLVRTAAARSPAPGSPPSP